MQDVLAQVCYADSVQFVNSLSATLAVSFVACTVDCDHFVELLRMNSQLEVEKSELENKFTEALSVLQGKVKVLYLRIHGGIILSTTQLTNAILYY